MFRKTKKDLGGMARTKVPIAHAIRLAAGEKERLRQEYQAVDLHTSLSI